MTSIEGNIEGKTLYPCKYCGAQENEKYGLFDVPWKTAQHVRNECPKSPKKRGTTQETQQRTAATPQETTISQEKLPLFPHPSTPTDVMRKVLQDWDVDTRIIERASKIAERAGPEGLHPQELRGILRDMTSGKTAKEIAYIVDDYYNGLIQAEEDAREQGERAYGPLRRGGNVRDFGFGDRRYPPRRNYDESYEPYYDERRYQYPQYPSPERRTGESTETVEKRLEVFENKLMDQIKKSKEEDRIEKLNTTVTELTNEIRNIKENPPKEPEQPLSENPYVKMLEKQVELERESRKEDREEAKEQRKEYTDIITSQSNTLKELEAKASRGSGETYSDDGARLAADTMHELADTVKHREPIKIIVEGVKGIIGEGTITPPEREKVVGESKITQNIPKEYLE